MEEIVQVDEALCIGSILLWQSALKQDRFDATLSFGKEIAVSFG